MTDSEYRAYINTRFGANGIGAVSGPVLRTALLESLDRFEQADQFKLDFFSETALRALMRTGTQWANVDGALYKRVMQNAPLPEPPGHIRTNGGALFEPAPVNGYIDFKVYKPTGDGTASDTDKLIKALQHCQSRKAGLLIPTENNVAYRLGQQMLFTDAGTVHIRPKEAGGRVRFLANQSLITGTAAGHLLDFAPTARNLPGLRLDRDYQRSEYELTFTLAPGTPDRNPTAGMQAGDLLHLRSTDWFNEASNMRKGEVVQIDAVLSDTTVRLRSPLADYYTAAGITAGAITVFPFSAVVLEDVDFFCDGAKNPLAGALRIATCQNSIIRRCTFEGSARAGLTLDRTYGDLVEYNRFRGHNAAGLGYGVMTMTSTAGKIFNNRSMGCRKLGDLSSVRANGPSHYCEARGNLAFGQGQVFTWIGGENDEDAELGDVQSFCIATHGGAADCIIEGNVGVDCRNPFQVRGDNVQLRGNYIFGFCTTPITLGEGWNFTCEDNYYLSGIRNNGQAFNPSLYPNSGMVAISPSVKPGGYIRIKRNFSDYVRSYMIYANNTLSGTTLTVTDNEARFFCENAASSIFMFLADGVADVRRDDYFEGNRYCFLGPIRGNMVAIQRFRPRVASAPGVTPVVTAYTGPLDDGTNVYQSLPNAGLPYTPLPDSDIPANVSTVRGAIDALGSGKMGKSEVRPRLTNFVRGSQGEAGTLEAWFGASGFSAAFTPETVVLPPGAQMGTRYTHPAPDPVTGIRPAHSGTLLWGERTPIDPALIYELAFSVENGGGGVANDANFRLVMGLECVDIDGLRIDSFHGSYWAGSLTTLAQPLNPGDSQITLTSATGWQGANASAIQRSITWWPYVNGRGQVFQSGYSRNNTRMRTGTPYTDAAGGTFAQGGINANVVTLTAPWPAGWPALPVGTPIANGIGTSYGAIMMLAGGNQIVVPAGPQRYALFAGGGVATGALTTSNVSEIQFRPGTVAIRPYTVVAGTAANIASGAVMRLSQPRLREYTARDLPPLSKSGAPVADDIPFTGLGRWITNTANSQTLHCLKLNATTLRTILST